MKKVYQKEKNDCFRACVASILECPIEFLPEFHKGAGSLKENFKTNFDSWVKSKPFNMVEIVFDKKDLKKFGRQIMITVFKIKDSDRYHSVLTRKNKIIHDPQGDKWVGDVIEDSEIDHHCLFLPKNPAIPFCPICLSQMVKSRIECIDGSGWMFGWACDCTDETRK